MQKTVVPPKPRALRLAEPEVRRTAVPMVRRVAAGALMTAVVVGSTAGVTLAASRDGSDSTPVVVRPSSVTPTPRVQDVAYTAATTVYTWPSASSTKSTAVRVTDPDQGVVRRAGTATRLALVWAVAATVATAGIMAGSMLRRR